MTRILFVDDEFEVLDAIRRNLRSKGDGWELDFVTSAEHAMDKMSQTPVDVIVTDMRMSHMQGDHLVRHVQDSFPQTVPIVLSGFTEPAVERKLLDDGVMFLRKPCDTSTLVSSIHDALRAMEAKLVQAPPQPAGLAFGGTVEIEEYLLLLTGILVQNRLLDPSAIPAAVSDRLKIRHRLPKIESRFLDSYEDSPAPADAIPLAAPSRGREMFRISDTGGLYKDTSEGWAKQIRDAD